VVRFIDFVNQETRATIPDAKLEILFDSGDHTKNVDMIFKPSSAKPDFKANPLMKSVSGRGSIQASHFCYLCKLGI